MGNQTSSERFASPLRYPGGKGCIFPFISKLFYENQLIGTSYAEPYAGGAGLALRLLYDEFVDRIYINDLDRAIYSFWKSAVDNTTRLCDWIADIDISVDTWRYCKSIQLNSDTAELLDLAKATFFLNRTNVSGVLKGGIIGGYKQKGKYKIDARFNKDDLIRRIQKIERYKDRISVSNHDGMAFITKLNRTFGDTLIYCDPPYLQKGSDLYLNFYSRRDHARLCRRIVNLRKRWIVSYDNHDFILGLYQAQQKVCYKLSQSASNRVGDEILIFSDGLSFEKSIHYLKTPRVVS